MSRARGYADRDTWITEASATSNFGLSPILEVWNKINPNTNSKEWARMMVRFSLSSLTAGIVNTGRYPDPRTDTSVSAYLYMFNAPHGDPQTSNFNLWTFPLTASWSEGSGLDNDRYSQTGFADSLSADNTNSWMSLNAVTGAGAFLGADNGVYDSNSANVYFDNGEENMKADVTSWFNAHLNGVSSNNGFLIRMSDTQEAKDATETAAAGANASVSANSYFTKKFYGRETNTRLRPYIQLEWPGAIKDDRSHLRFSKTGNLFFYNIVDGVLEDLNSTKEFPGSVTVSANGVGVSPIGITASRFSKGVYKVNVGSSAPAAGGSLTGLNLGTSGATAFVDSWTVTTAGEYKSFNFGFTPDQPVQGSSVFTTANYHVNLINAKSNYDYGSVARIRVFVRDKNTALRVVTGGTTATTSFVVRSGSVEIREKATDMVEVQEFDLSYDNNGNFFELDTNNLYPHIEYKVVLKLNIRGETNVYDDPEKWNFTVQ
tara:strand:- start:932 stop:2395 length:1464 start_codon:yes stop_codon:yes gene_type:complete